MLVCINKILYYLKIIFRSFSIQLKFPRRAENCACFRTKHVQSWHFKDHAENITEKKLENFQLSWRISQEKNIKKSTLSKPWKRQPAMWQQLSVYPVGLTKTYSGIYYDCNNNNKCSKKISNSMKQNKMVLINKTFKKNKTTWYQTADLYWSGQKKPDISLQSKFTIQSSTSEAAKTTRKRKKLGAKLTLLLAGAFQVSLRRSH